MPGGAFKRESCHTAAAAGGLYDGPRCHAAAAAAAATAVANARPLYAPSLRCKQPVALPSRRRHRRRRRRRHRGWFESHTDHNRQPLSAAARLWREASEV